MLAFSLVLAPSRKSRLLRQESDRQKMPVAFLALNDSFALVNYHEFTREARIVKKNKNAKVGERRSSTRSVECRLLRF
jgi:hypothetical protein